MELFDNFDVGREMKLVVKVSEDKERREERMTWMKKEQKFLSSLNATGELEEFTVNKDIPHNPLEPRYVPQNPTSPEKSTPPASEFNGPPGIDPLGSSAGAASLKASPPSTENGTGESSPNQVKKKSVSPTTIGDSVKEKSPCYVCQKLTAQCCFKCKLPYCSRECQKDDWAEHMKVCGVKKKSDPTATPVEKPLSIAKPAENSEPTSLGPLRQASSLDDDGFYISVGDEDLSEVLASYDGHILAALPSTIKRNLNASVSATPTTPLKVSRNLGSPKSSSTSSPEQGNEGDIIPSTPPGGPSSPVASSTTPDLLLSPPRDGCGDVALSNSVAGRMVGRGVCCLSMRQILSVFDQCPTPLSSHPCGEFPPEEFTGIVTSVFSSTQFNAVVASSSVKQAMVDMLAYGLSVTPNYCGQADLKEGLLYGYIDDDGDFYRVMLFKKSDGIVELYDIRAKGVTVQSARLFHLSDKIKSIPRLCYQLTLRGLYYDSDKKKDGIQFLFNLVKARPMVFKNHSISAFKSNVSINFIVCTIASLDRSIDIAEEIVKMDFAKVVGKESSNGDKCKDSPWPMLRKRPESLLAAKDGSPDKATSPVAGRGEKKNGGLSPSSSRSSPQVSDGNQSPSPLRAAQASTTPDYGSPDKLGNFQKSLSNRQLSWEKRPLSLPTQKATAPANERVGKYKLVQMSSKVPYHNPHVGVMIEIQPKVVLNPNIIWAQVIHNKVEHFHRMEADLNSVYGSCKHDKPYTPTPGEIVAAKFAQDQKYYRVEVLCINHSGTLDIRFVDYGNRETVTVSQVHHLEPIFLSLPKQALHFSLAGVVPAGLATSWSENAVAYLKEKILNRRVLVKILMQTPTTCMAEVWDPDSPMKLINTSLVDLGLAEAQEISSFSVGSGSGRNTPVLSGVSITARQDQPMSRPDQLEEKQKQSSPHESSSCHWGSSQSSQSQPVLLKPGDFEKPTPLPSMNTSTSLLPCSSMKTATCMSSNFPDSMTSDFSKCERRLSRSPSVESGMKSSFNDSSPSKFVSSPLFCKPSSSGNVAKSSNLHSISPTSVPKLCEWSPTKPTTPTSPAFPVESATANVNGWSPASSQTQLSSQTQGRSQKVTIGSVPFEPSEDMVEAVVVTVENPLKFWIQIINKRVIDHYEKMKKKLDSISLVPYVNPSRGDFCLCGLPNDGGIYRVKVIEVDCNSLLVQRVDHGDRKKVATDEVFRISPELASVVPAQAIQCTLNQLLNPNGKGKSWKQEAIDFFKDKVGFGSSSTVKVKCVNIINRVLHVVEVKTSAKKGGTRDLLELMVEARLGNTISIKCDRSNNKGNKSNENYMGRRSYDQSPSICSETTSKQEPPSMSTLTRTNGSAFRKKGMNSKAGISPVASPNAMFSHRPTFDKSAVTQIPVSSLKKISFPSNFEVFYLLVTEVCSPDELYVQTVENSNFLERLSSSLNHFFSTSEYSPLTQPPANGSLVCAKFSQDGAWYRAELLEAAADACRVKFIDFGNIEIVQLRDMAVCPSDIVSFPILANCCCLDGVSPPSGSQSWPEGATQLLKELSSDILLEAVVVSHDKSPPALKLTNTSSGQNIELASELIKQGVASDSRIPSKLNSSTEQDVCETRVKYQNTICAYPRTASLQKLSLPSSDSFPLLVTEVYNPGEFYVQTKDSCESLSELSAKLVNYFSTNKYSPLTQLPSIGSLVCAKFSQDGAWYRGEVMEAAADACRVKFIDFGNIEIVQLCDMAVCPSDLLSFPILANCCCLDGVSPPSGSQSWPEGATQLLKELSSDILLEAVVVSHDKSPPALKLTNTSNGQNIELASELIKQGVASDSKILSKQNFAEREKVCETIVKCQSIICAYPKIASLQKLTLPSSDSFPLLVTEIYNPGEFYVQLYDSCESFNELSTVLNNYFSTNKYSPLTQPPANGSLVCAKFSQDGAWYRGEVLEAAADACHVKFIDYGNVEIVQLRDMAECPSDIVSFPILANCCCLDGVSPPSGSQSWPEGATQLLKELSSDILLEAVIVSHDKSPPALKLTNTSSGQNIELASELIKEGVAADSRIPSKLKSSTEQNVCETRIKYQNTICAYPKIASLHKLSLPSSDSFPLLVTEVYNPGEFYVQTKDSCESLSELSTKLVNYFSTNKYSPLTQLPSIGSLVCAKFSQDGAWYRGEVMEAAADACHVKFIDFGNIEIVQLRDMAVCPSDLLSFPILANCCCLDGVSPPSGSQSWPEGATQLLKELSSDILLEAVVVSHDKSPPALKLTNTSNGQNIELASELIKEGVASDSRIPSKLKSSTEQEVCETRVKYQNTICAYPRTASLQKLTLPSSDSFPLLVTEVYNPGEFYVQTKDSCESLAELSTTLNNYFSTNKYSPLTQLPSIGSLVCAKFSQDGAWYRGEVMEAAADACCVKFIDYGNYEVVRLCDMSECPPEALSLPILSCCCRLGGVTLPTDAVGWSDSAVQLLKEMSVNRLLQGTVTDGSTCPPSVHLKDNLGSDLASQLVAKGLALSRPSSSGLGNDQTLPTPQLSKASDLSEGELPCGSQYFSVIVTEVCDPGNFFIQTVDVETFALSEALQNRLAVLFQEGPSPPRLNSLPSRGSLVCAKYSQDNLWYRAEVMESRSSCSKVMFVDYGNIEVAKLEEMAFCPSELCSYPVLARRCSLSGLAPLPLSDGSGGSWSVGATSEFRKLTSGAVLNAKVTGKGEGGETLIELVNTSVACDVVIASELVKLGLAKSLIPPSNGAASRASHDDDALPSVLPCSSGNLSPSGPSHNISPSVVPSNNSDSDVKPSVPICTSVDVLPDDIPNADIPSRVSIQVHVPVVNDPSSFFVRHMDRNSMSALRALMTNIQSTYGEFSSTNYGGFVPKVGAVCCCQAADRSWYRSRVVVVSGSTCIVQCVDFGFTEEVPVDRLMHLLPKFSKLPAQAVPCYLRGVEPTSPFGWNEISRAVFKSLVGERARAVVEPETSSSVCDSKRAVTLYTDKNDASVAAALVRGGYASEIKVVSPKSEQSKANSLKRPQSVVPIPLCLIPSTKSFAVTLTHIESLSEFYFHIATDENLNELCELLRTVHDYAQVASGFNDPPPVGSLCIAMHTDSSWYRAQVIKVLDEETCAVFFFDFGNKASVSLFNMKPITDDKLLSYPIQALKGGLYGASVLDDARLSEALDLVKTLVPCESLKTCHLISLYPLLVDLDCGSGFPSLSLREELARGGYIPKPSDLGTASLPVNKLPTDSTPVVLVTEVKDPSSFWIQIIDQSVTKPFEKLMLEIQYYAGSGSNPTMSTPYLGQLCVANYSKDNIWYRAKIVHVGDGQKVKVQFVDYGNEEVVDANQLLPFKHSFMTLPAQAVHCRLAGVKVASENVTSKFVEMVEDKSLRAVNKGKPGELATSVVLIDTSEEENIYINKELL